MNNRQTFLTSFLGALGAEKILWKENNERFIKGTVIYDIEDDKERQDFIWKITESKSPDNCTQALIDFIKNEKLLDIDKLTKSIDEINPPNLSNNQKNISFDNLVNIRVRMIDDGEETDSYFIHE
ncbi:MAG: hypothetical protein COB60_01275 [Flavobacteriaceae bacterium]|nr:MAG: hypothetical protein COB60_01275 [Flavobacteriaceae bacterium]